MAAADVKARLAAHTSATCTGVHVSVSTANSSFMDFAQRGLGEVVRASPHYYNTHAEVAAFVHALRTVIADAG